MTHQTDTIVACATPTGGAIAVVRMSGAEAISIADQMFRPHGRRSIADAEGYTAHYGEVIDAGAK